MSEQKEQEATRVDERSSAIPPTGSTAAGNTLTPSDPLPWACEGWQQGCEATIVDLDGKAVAELYGDYYQQVQNGDYLARAANCFPDLLAALRSVHAYLRSEEHWPVKAEHIAYLADINAAICKAEGR